MALKPQFVTLVQFHHLLLNKLTNQFIVDHACLILNQAFHHPNIESPLLTKSLPQESIYPVTTCTVDRSSPGLPLIP